MCIRDSLRALTIVVSGRPFRPAKAQKLGMVNEVVPRELVEPAAKDWLAKGKRSKRKLFLGNLRPAGWFVAWRARKETLARTRGNYPAPLAAIKVLRKATFAPLEKAMALERRVFAGLAKTATPSKTTNSTSPPTRTGRRPKRSDNGP